MALTSPVSILTGGPGTGKTHTLRAVLTLARAKRLRCLLAAPTGRAAKRMTEATGLPAGTLHRTLELRPGGRAGRRSAGTSLRHATAPTWPPPPTVPSRRVLCMR